MSVRGAPERFSGAWAVDLAGVDKVYKGKVHALRGVDIKIKRGEIFGLLGPNGAGKSTLVKILMTVIGPTRATGTMLGRPIGHKPTLARVGYLPEHHKFPEYLTGAQVVDFYAALAGVPRVQRRRKTPELLEMVGMQGWGDKRVRGYSKGMRQRVGIAQALACEPDLVVLDEPTDGVDPVGRKEIRELLSRIKQSGATVLLNSHLLSELEMVCDRVAILVQGKVAMQGTIDELTTHRRVYEIELDAGGTDIARSLGAALTPANTLSTGERVEISAGFIRIGTDDARHVQPVIDALRSAGVILKSVRPFRPSLEDLFMEAVRDPTTGKSRPPGAAR